MTWTPEGPQGNEAAKISHLIVPYTRGRGLDVGCGAYKAFPHFIGIDSGKQWGQPVTDITGDGSNLGLFSDGGMDFVFSSHFLEHVNDYKAALREWWRVIRPGGHLALYLPHKGLYPNVGEDGSNPDHKHDFMPEDILQAMTEIADLCGRGWDCLEYEDRGEGIEYSFFQVYRKRDDGEKNFTPWTAEDRKGSCLVIRYGAYGDLIQTSSVTALLKREGWKVTLNTTPNGHDVVRCDPNIDAFLIQDKDQVPQGMLSEYWQSLSERFERVINLSESVEGGLLALAGRANHSWESAARRKILGSVNYMERMHDIACLPHEFRPAFHPTLKERNWAQKERHRVGGQSVILWALAGSSVHKAYPFVQDVLLRILSGTAARVVLCGGPECRILEEFILESLLSRQGVTRQHLEAWQAEMGEGYLGFILKEVTRAYGGQTRIHCTSGKWSIRETLSFAQQADVVVGPETGVLNAVAAENPVMKVVLLSHSSHENLTKHWINTVAITPDTAKAPCYPCHQLHYDRTYCPDDGETGASLCAASIAPSTIYDAILEGIRRTRAA